MEQYDKNPHNRCANVVINYKDRQDYGGTKKSVYLINNAR